MLAAAASFGAVAGNICGQRAQRSEDAYVVFVVGAQLKAIALGNDQSDFTSIESGRPSRTRAHRVDAGRSRFRFNAETINWRLRQQGTDTCGEVLSP
jgi:hypothetical protein